MEEIVAGAQKPLDASEMSALLARYLPKIREATEQTRLLRQRIAHGQEVLRLPDLTSDERTQAEALMRELQNALRYQEGWATIGLGMALGHGVACVIAEAAKTEGWMPPANSVLRLVLPGQLNLSVDLCDPAHHEGHEHTYDLRDGIAPAPV